MMRSSSTLSKVWGLPLCVALLIAVSVSEVEGQTLEKFCSLFNPTNQGKMVTSTALMFHSTVGRVDGADTFLYSPDCNGPDYFAIPEINSRVWSKWNRFFKNLPSEKNLILELTFEGSPDVATGHLFGSLDGWARAQIILSKIISIKDVTKTTGIAAKWDAKKPEIERVEGMRTLLDIFLRSLYAPSSTEQPVLDLLSDEFRFVDHSGKIFKKDEYRTLDAPWAKSSGAIKESRMSRRLISSTNATMKWRAAFELSFSSAPSKTYYCDITLARQGDEWIIRDATMVTKH